MVAITSWGQGQEGSMVEQEGAALRAFVRRVREWRGWSMTELAARSGLNARTYIAYETGTNADMMASRLMKVLQALGVPSAILDRLGGKSGTAADGEAVAEGFIRRAELAERVRANPSDGSARYAYAAYRMGELVLEQYDVETAKGIVARELRELGYEPSDS